MTPKEIQIDGDEINYLNCRSIWVDNKGREYRVHQLMTSI
jgi:hypothetical protein